jgi:glutaredoxin 2
MNLTFYHYVHCPFCIRVRMTAGFFKLSYKSIVVPYDDEATPVRLTGKKMLPIMEINGKPVNESLDIMQILDEKNILKISNLTNDPNYTPFNELLSKLGNNVHNLAMPYWIYTPEFNERSRAYFQKKKEEKRGPFSELVKKKEKFIQDISQDLADVAKDLKPFYRSDVFTVYDILLASHIWGLYVVPEFQFEEKVHNYLQNVKALCQFDYHQDFWK